MEVHKINPTRPLSTSGQRMRAARTSLGLTGEAFGQGIRITKGSVSSWENDARTPDGPSLVALQYVYKLNPEWIVHGTGPMWLDEATSLASSGSEDEFLNRPLIVGAASCGPGGEILDPGPGASRYALRRDFASRIFNRCGGGTEKDLFFLLCRGESMSPTIQDKEIVLVNTAMGIRTEPRNNGIYLVRRAQEDSDARVKRIRLDRDRQELVLGSDNRTFPQATIDLDGIPLPQLILGRVCWVGRYLLDTDPPAEDW